MAINAQFQQILGRIPTPEEAAYFQKFIDAGDLGEHEIGQILQATPEYQSAQLTKNTAQFGQTLQANDSAVLSQAADRFGAQAQSKFAGLGRPNSSAMAAQVFSQGGQLAGNLAQSRQSALADFYGNGLRTNAANAAAQGQGAVDRGYGLRDERRQRGYQIEDYYRMKNDYQDEKNASSGWNAITPEFAVSQAIGIGGALGGSYLGGIGAGRGMAGKGLFGR